MKHIPKAPGIYAIVNVRNRKRYVGSAKSMRHRVVTHRQHLRGGYHLNPHLQKAWNKWSEKSFRFVVLAKCSVEMLVETEQTYLDKYNAADKRYGYNICPIAESRLGSKAHATTCELLSRSGRKRYEDPTELAKIRKQLAAYRSNAKIERKRKLAAAKALSDPAYKKATSARSKKQWRNRATRNKILKKLRDPEARRRNSERLKKLWASKRYREKLLKSHQRRMRRLEEVVRLEKMRERADSPLVRKKIGKVAKKVWADPKYRSRQVRAHKLWYASKKGQRHFAKMNRLKRKAMQNPAKVNYAGAM